MTKKIAVSTKNNKEASLASEKLDAIGHENESQGIKWTKHFMDEDAKQQYVEGLRVQEGLKQYVKNKGNYTNALADLLNRNLNELDVPMGFSTMVEVPDKDHIAVKFVDKWDRLWGWGFKPSQRVKEDFFMVNQLTAACDFKMSQLDQDKVTDSGIHLS